MPHARQTFCRLASYLNVLTYFLARRCFHEFCMSNVRIQTAQNVDLEVELAGLGDRVIAALLDYALIVAYVIGVSIVVGVILGLGEWGVLLMMLPALLYFPVFEIFSDGQSVGKAYMNIRVRRLDGGSPTVGAYLIRWLLRPIDVTMTTGAAGVASILFTQANQRLGDVAAGTTVVRIQETTTLRDTSLADVEDDREVVFPQAERLTDDDVAMATEVANTIATSSRTAATKDIGRRMKRVLERKMGVESDMKTFRFLRTVIADYNSIHGTVSTDAVSTDAVTSPSDRSVR
jgi:uncharacterized RDD family membrane protein YckC